MNKPRALSRPRGTHDVLPEDCGRLQAVERIAREVFESFGYAEIRTPTFEEAALYQRSSGAASDVVSKQMYVFEDRKGRLMALRPEGTPGVIRAYLESNLHKRAPQQKLYYIGPMFRYERPQAGRDREFSQLGVEAIGYDDVATDFELISMVWLFYRKLGLAAHSLTLKINSLGDTQDRRLYAVRLQEYLRSRQDDLCTDCLDRLERNPLRVFDCGREKCGHTIEGAPRISDHLGAASAEHHNRLREYLQESNVPFEDDPGLVRGLDYYTRTVFEIMHSGLGAKDSVMGGGRYDDLIEQLGGPPTPAAGFAIGMPRTLLAIEQENVELCDGAPPQVYIAPLGDEADKPAASLSFALAEQLVRHIRGACTKSLKSHLKAANRLGAECAYILGPDEIAAGNVTVRNLSEGTQCAVPLEKLRKDALGNI